MPMEHLREDGALEQSYFCNRCGQPVGMYGHSSREICQVDPVLVRKLIEINNAGSMEQYVFNKLKATNEDR